MIPNKKTSILLVLRTLEEYTDEDHYLTQKEILERIEKDYGITIERKSVGSSIALLRELDYDINKGPKGGYALLSRLLDPSEIRFLTDAAFSSRSLTGKQAANMSKRLQSLVSKNQRANYNYILKSDQLTRAKTSDVFYAIDVIERAIKEGKRIRFKYQSYDKHGKPCLSMNGFEFFVSPYYLVNNFGRYYLVGNYRIKYGLVSTYRLDLIREPKIAEDWDIKPLESLPGGDAFNITDYLNEHIYLFGGETVQATLRVDDRSKGVQYLEDWFGDNYRLIEKDDELLAKVKCNETSLFYWILQYSDCFTLIEPDSLIDRLKDHLRLQNEKYGI